MSKLSGFKYNKVHQKSHEITCEIDFQKMNCRKCQLILKISQKFHPTMFYHQIEEVIIASCQHFFLTTWMDAQMLRKSV